MSRFPTPHKNEHGTYYVRIRVPDALRIKLKKSIIKRSLNTKCPREAKRRFPLKLLEVMALFEAIRTTNDQLDIPSTYSIYSLCHQWKNCQLEYIRKNDNEIVNWATQNVDDSSELAQDVTNNLAAIKTNPSHEVIAEGFAVDAWQQFKKEPQVYRTEIKEVVSPAFNQIVKAFGAPHFLSEQKIIEIELTLLSCFIEISEVCVKATQGLPNDLYTLNDSQSIKPSSNSSTPLLSELITRYNNYYETEDRSDYQRAFSRALDYFGDVKITEITKSKVHGFITILKQLPPAKNEEIKALSLNDQIKKADAEGLPRISPNTVKNVIHHVSALFTFALQLELITTNPFTNLELKRIEKPISEQELKSYTSQELQLIFSSDLFTDFNSHEMAERFGAAAYFIPLLLRYTGARREELCQLKLGQITVRNGIHCFIVDSSYGGSVKNKSSERFLPIPPQVQDLGILNYIQSRKANANNEASAPLFPELTPNKGKWGTAFGRRWSRFIKDDLQITRKTLKPIHSFRDTVEEDFRVLDINSDTAQIITGRSIKHSGKAYGGRLRAAYEAISKLPRLPNHQQLIETSPYL